MVVVNGAAGDPLGEKDAFLISRLPHLVLDGAQVAADAIEARQILVSIVDRAGVYDVMERAMGERRRAGTDEAPMKLVPAPDRYVTGESSATAAHLSGSSALPTHHPPHTAERGVKGRPTLVQNVETMANLALLSRNGSEWFRQVGQPTEPGSLVLTVRGAVAQPSVVEVPVGATVEQALSGVGWLTEPVGAVLVGGCAGRWLPATTALAAPLSHAGMAAAGGTLGAGIVIALPDRACGLDETARLARYLADQSAGQCGACLNGLPAIAGALTALATGKGDRSTVSRLHRWCSIVSGRGACSHPDGTTGLVALGARGVRRGRRPAPGRMVRAAAARGAAAAGRAAEGEAAVSRHSRGERVGVVAAVAAARRGAVDHGVVGLRVVRSVRGGREPGSARGTGEHRASAALRAAPTAAYEPPAAYDAGSYGGSAYGAAPRSARRPTA